MALYGKMAFWKIIRLTLCGLLGAIPAFSAPTVVGPPKPSVPLLVPNPENGSNSGGKPAYDLNKALNLALQQNTKIRIAQTEIERSKGVIIQSRATLYPTVTLNGNVSGSNPDPFFQTKQKGDSEFSADWGVSLNITKNIFSGFKNRRAIEVAKLQNDAAFIQYEALVNQILFQVKDHFYKILLKQMELETKRETIKLLGVERDRQKNLFEAGRSTKFSILRIEVSLANEKADEIQIEQELLSTKVILSELMGISWGADYSMQAPFQITGKLECPTYRLELSKLLQMARERRPELRNLEKQIQIGERKVKIERASNIPEVDLYADTQSQNDPANPTFFDQKNNFTAGIQGRWALFDGFLGKGKAEEEQARLDSSKIERQDQLRAIDSEVRIAYNQMQQSLLIMNTQKDNVKLAEQSLELSRLNLETGFGTVLDTLQATVDLSRARNVESRARHDYLLAIAQLERSVSLRFQDTASVATP